MTTDEDDTEDDTEAEDGDDAAVVIVQLAWVSSPSTPGLYSAHAGHLVADAAPSIRNPGGSYWRVYCDGCAGCQLDTGEAARLDYAMRAAEDSIYAAWRAIRAAFPETAPAWLPRLPGDRARPPAPD